MDIRKIGLLNLLLIFVPVAIFLKFSGAEGMWIFIVSGIAIIPLAGLMGKSTEMLADKLGAGWGGLLNATFGNAAELIIALFALKRGMIEVVKSSVTGSILGIVLLVLGASFLAGGLKHSRQSFNPTAAGMSATLLVLAAIGLVVPAMFHVHLELFHTKADEQVLSLEIAVVLFLVYVLMLIFSLVTHKHLYAGEEDNQNGEEESFADVEGHWSPKTAMSVLVGATVTVALMSEFLVGSIEEARTRMGLTEAFVGLIVVAIVGNAAEHSTAVLVAMKNRMELSYQIAVGSALQIALFVAPVLVFAGYLPGFTRMNLVFSMLEVVAIVVSVLVVGLVAFDGQSNWLEGLLLLAVYLILAIAFYHLPEQEAHEEARAVRNEPAGVLLCVDDVGRNFADPNVVSCDPSVSRYVITKSNWPRAIDPCYRMDSVLQPPRHDRRRSTRAG